MIMPLTRRQFLITGGVGAGVVIAGGAGAYALVENDVLPGRVRLNTALGACGQPVPRPGVAIGPTESGQFESTARRTNVGWTIAYPPGTKQGDALPLCIALHGGSATQKWIFNELSMQYFLADVVQQGSSPPFAIASIDGGDGVNWHKRATGDDPQAMIIDEFVPMLTKKNLVTKPVGLWGVSLGGYGALLLAGKLGAARCASVAVSSPAIWSEFDQVQPGRYDGPADFAANNLFTRTGELDGIPVRIDCGDSDAFTPGVRKYINTLSPRPSGGIAEGCHDLAFWTRSIEAQLGFIGNNF